MADDKNWYFHFSGVIPGPELPVEDQRNTVCDRLLHNMPVFNVGPDDKPIGNELGFTLSFSVEGSNPYNILPVAVSMARLALSEAQIEATIIEVAAHEPDYQTLRLPRGESLGVANLSGEIDLTDEFLQLEAAQ